MNTNTAHYFLGLDLGQKNDWTALAVLQRKPGPSGFAYDVIHAERWRGRPYHEFPAELKVLYPLLEKAGRDALSKEIDWSLGMPRVDVRIHLVVDGTGVGVAVVDSLRAAGLECTSVTIHGGDAVSGKGDELRVPKRELVEALQVLLQQRRLAISGQLPLADVLIKELENFRAKIKLSGHDIYGAGEDWRDGNHDDLVLAVALAAWYGENYDDTGFDELDAYMDRQLGRV